MEFLCLYLSSVSLSFFLCVVCAYMHACVYMFLCVHASVCVCVCAVPERVGKSYEVLGTESSPLEE